MDQYVTGTTIRELREKNRMTQQQLADRLFFTNVVKGIDDKESGYDDNRERRELEKAVKMLFG